MDDAMVDAILGALRSGSWPVVAALAIHVLVRLTKADITSTPTIPAGWRPVLAIALGAVSGACEAVVRGVPWQDALARGALSGALAIGGHLVAIEGMRGGREIGARSDA